MVGALQPTIGTVRIDGAKLTDWDQDELGKYFGYMPQESSLFEGSIKENIARFETGGGDDAKRIDDAVVAAAKEAGIHDLILQLPKGYDTALGLMGSASPPARHKGSLWPGRFIKSPVSSCSMSRTPSSIRQVRRP